MKRMFLTAVVGLVFLALTAQIVNAQSLQSQCDPVPTVTLGPSSQTNLGSSTSGVTLSPYQQGGGVGLQPAGNGGPSLTPVNGGAAWEYNPYDLNGASRGTPMVSGELLKPYWQRFSRASVNASWMQSARKDGFDALMIDGSAAFDMIHQGQSQPTEAFRGVVGATLAIGRVGTFDTAYVDARVGLEWFKTIQIDKNVDDLFVRVAAGPGWRQLFGTDDESKDSALSFWSDIELRFASWSGLGGVHPALSWSLSISPKSESITSMVSLYAQFVVQSDMHLYVGVKWGHDEKEDAFRVNTLGPAARIMIFMEDMIFVGSVSLLYEEQTLRRGVVGSGWATVFTIGLEF